jgi:hypothetical protein
VWAADASNTSGESPQTRAPNATRSAYQPAAVTLPSPDSSSETSAGQSCNQLILEACASEKARCDSAGPLDKREYCRHFQDCYDKWVDLQNDYNQQNPNAANSCTKVLQEVCSEEYQDCHAPGYHQEACRHYNQCRENWTQKIISPPTPPPPFHGLARQ